MKWVTGISSRATCTLSAELLVFLGVTVELWFVIRKLADWISFALEIMWMGSLPSLFMLFYVFLIGYAMVLGAALGLGAFVWAIPVALSSPVVYIWYKVMEQRYRAYLAMMMSTQPANWDTDAAIDGWLNLLRAKKREKKK